MRIIRIIARLLNFIRSHWLIKSLKIDNNVFFLWSINEYIQLKKINSSVKCAMYVVSSNVLLQMIKSKCNIWKDLIAFADNDRWIRQCIFKIAHVSHWTIFEAFFWVISISSIFFSWLIISDRQFFNRKCQFQKIVFVNIFLWDWIALTNFSTNRYFNRNKSCFFSMSHIITSIDLIISAFLYMSHTKSCFLKRVTNIKITLINDTYAMFSKNIFRFLSLM
jgi:hypothetical protein